MTSTKPLNGAALQRYNLIFGAPAARRGQPHLENRLPSHRAIKTPPPPQWCAPGPAS